MTNVLCVRCGEPIVFGQLFRMIQDESGRATYSHVMRVGDEFMPGCPQPDPVAEGGEEEEPATEGSASLQVNTADLSGARERMTGEGPSTDGAPRSRVGAAPTFDSLNDDVLAGMDAAPRLGDVHRLVAEVRRLRVVERRAVRVEAAVRRVGWNERDGKCWCRVSPELPPAGQHDLACEKLRGALAEDHQA